MGFVSLRYFIVDTIELLTGDKIWIGANDFVNEGTFVWAGGPEAGRSVNSIYTNWGSREPNSEGNEDCVEIRKDIGQWNDEGCGTGRWSLIEYSCSPEQEFGSTACQSTCSSFA